MHLQGHDKLLKQHHALRSPEDHWFYPHRSVQKWICFPAWNGFQAHPVEFNETLGKLSYQKIKCHPKKIERKIQMDNHSINKT